MSARFHSAVAATVVLVAAGFTAALVGCASAPFGANAIVPAPAAAAVAATSAGMSAAEISRAADLYVLKCARCHKFHDPADYADAEWGTWMTKMSQKARLPAEDAALLARYLDASRKVSVARGPASPL